MSARRRGRAARACVLALAAACPPGWAPGARAAATPDALLAAVFTDHVVLQQQAPLSLWGTATPGAALHVQLGPHAADAIADGQGRWSLRGPVLEAGGPYVLRVDDGHGRVQVVQDVQVGEAWLCSGQSNMGLPVAASHDGERVANASHDPLLRLFTVAHRALPAPARDVPVGHAWEPAGPGVVRDFSAACYYFGRSLRRQHPDVAVGLVHASWEGSRIEPWIPAGALRSVSRDGAALDALQAYADDPVAGLRRFVAGWQDWWRSASGGAGTPWAAGAGQAGEGWQAVPQPLRDWKTWGVEALSGFDGLVWYRHEFELSPAQAAGGARLDLGGIDEVDITWVNGQPVGTRFGWGDARSYDVPAGVLHAGTNSVVVAVLSTWDAGGLLGAGAQRALRPASGPPVPLDDGWLYRAALGVRGPVPTAPWLPLTGSSVLYDGMISPLAPFPLAGVAWYQGESNTGEPQDYERQLGALMGGWRAAFGQPLRFLVVQLPGFGALPGKAPAESGWASLREAQRRAVLADAGAALVPTLDLGDWDELHPAAKQPVGERLALAARRLAEGGPRIAGTAPVRATRPGRGAVRIDFTGPLAVHGSLAPAGFQACFAGRGCRYAGGRVSGAAAWVDVGPGAGLLAIRYAWEDSPTASLFGTDGLPVVPFEIPVGRPPAAARGNPSAPQAQEIHR